jgi:hypothetical protein
MDKALERLSKTYTDKNLLDRDQYTDNQVATIDSKKDGDGPIVAQAKTILRDMQETRVSKRERKKITGVVDLKMLDKMENAKKFESPATTILARGINIRIKDVLKEGTTKGKQKKQERITGIEHGISLEKEIVVPSFGATGELFAKHFDILRTLKRRILLLK